MSVIHVHNKCKNYECLLLEQKKNKDYIQVKIQHFATAEAQICKQKNIFIVSEVPIRLQSEAPVNAKAASGV